MPELTGDLTVEQTLARWPATIPVFLRHGTACVGCVMAPFETIDEIAAIYGLERDRLLDDLRAAAASAAASAPAPDTPTP